MRQITILVQIEASGHIVEKTEKMEAERKGT